MESQNKNSIYSQALKSLPRVADCLDKIAELIKADLISVCQEYAKLDTVTDSFKSTTKAIKDLYCMFEMFLSAEAQKESKYTQNSNILNIVTIILTCMNKKELMKEGEMTLEECNLMLKLKNDILELQDVSDEDFSMILNLLGSTFNYADTSSALIICSLKPKEKFYNAFVKAFSDIFRCRLFIENMERMIENGNKNLDAFLSKIARESLLGDKTAD